MEDPPRTDPDVPPRASVTQRVPLETVQDLLTQPARAAIAYVGSDGPGCLPVALIADVGMRIGVNAHQLPAGGLPDDVILAIDDGAYWFELRAAVWRGRVVPEVGGCSNRTDDDPDRVWFRFEPRRVTAWDYGQLREEIQQ